MKLLKWLRCLILGHRFTLDGGLAFFQCARCGGRVHYLDQKPWDRWTPEAAARVAEFDRK